MAGREVLMDGKTWATLENITYAKMCQTVVEGEDLVPGGVCAASLEVELAADTPLSRGKSYYYYHAGQLRGRFRVEEVRMISANRCRIVAYDDMLLLDRDVTEGVAAVLPCSGSRLLKALCEYVGISLGSFTVPSGTVPAVEGPVTGRQLLRWLGQKWAMWFRCDIQGRLVGGWVSDTERELGDYRMDALTVEAYDTAPIARVWVRENGQDVGTVYPDGVEAEENTLILEGNPLAPDPQGLYEALGGYSYRPFRCSVITAPPELGVTVVLPGGQRAPVLQRTLENGVWTVEAPGNPALQGAVAWNSLGWSDAQGRLTRVEKSVRGLEAEVADGDGRLTGLEVTAQGLTTRVEDLRAEGRTHGEASAVTAMRSQLTQRAQGLEYTVTQVRSGLGEKADAVALEEVSEHFRFDMEGLTITNSGTGMGIGISEKRVIFTGGTDPTTAIYPNAMKTTGLTVEKTLVLGQYALIPRSNGNLSLRFVGLSGDGAAAQT